MGDRHQHQTEERTAAEARVREARKSYDSAWDFLCETKQGFDDNAGNPGELRSFKNACFSFVAWSSDLDEAKAALDALDRSIP